ncbi:hypothetical protein M0804_009687 [Polistes exclamans]|nr:hypothetical protein M0804_009687 [Polistes exclamans]
MRRQQLTVTIEIMQQYHQNKINARDTAEDLLTYGYFKYPEVCVAAINYWFHYFDAHPGHFESEYPNNNLKERLAFLSVLLRNNPLWTTHHFIDALKIMAQYVKYFL